jgi:hypothetical protein
VGDQIISSNKSIETGVRTGADGAARRANGQPIVVTIDDHVRAVEYIMRALIGPDARMSCDLQASGAVIRLPSAAIEGAMLQLVNHARACGGIIRSARIRTRRSCGRIRIIFVYQSVLGRAESFPPIRDDVSLPTARRLVQSADGQFRIRFSKTAGTVILLTFPIQV